VEHATEKGTSGVGGSVSGVRINVMMERSSTVPVGVIGGRRELPAKHFVRGVRGRPDIRVGCPPIRGLLGQ
jgi:hypothetical protein